MSDDLNPELPVLFKEVEERIDAFLVEFDGMLVIHRAATTEGERCYCIEFHEEVETVLGSTTLEYVTGWYTTQTRAAYEAFLMWQGDIEPHFVRPLEFD